jgi:hypothetical protein
MAQDAGLGLLVALAALPGALFMAPVLAARVRPVAAGMPPAELCAVGAPLASIPAFEEAPVVHTRVAGFEGEPLESDSGEGARIARRAV